MAQALTSAIRRNFSPGVRQRGEAYFARGAVRVERIDAASIMAQAKGTRRCTTFLEWAGPEITAFRDCPYFDDVGPCKHLWAVAMMYDRSGRTPAGLAAIFDSVPHFRGHTQEIVHMTRTMLGEGYPFAWKPTTKEQGA